MARYSRLCEILISGSLVLHFLRLSRKSDAHITTHTISTTEGRRWSISPKNCFSCFKYSSVAQLQVSADLLKNFITGSVSNVEYHKRAYEDGIASQSGGIFVC